MVNKKTENSFSSDLTKTYWTREVKWQIEAMEQDDPNIKNVDIDKVVDSVIEDDYIWDEVNNRMVEYIKMYNNKAKKTKGR